MRIVLIGPVYPYKGGIAHYTGMMCKSLRKRHDVHMISYNMQYPRLLLKREQKDYQNDSMRIDDANYAIHTANPFNWPGVARRVNALHPDLVIIQWWHPYFAPCYHSIVKRLKNTRVLFVCHNVFPHERFFLDRQLTRYTLKCGGCFIVHSGQDAKDLCGILPKAMYEQTVLPTFNLFNLKRLTVHQARKKLDIDVKRKVLLFFGLVREYKGLAYLIEALPKLKEKFENLTLLIVGEFGGDKSKYTDAIDSLGVSDMVRIDDGYIPDREVEKYFMACDLVVLPYTSATQSGIVQIAYEFKKPVIASRVGGLPQVVAHKQTGYLTEPRDSAGIAAAITRFFDENRALEFSENIRQQAGKYDWDRIVDIVEKLYDQG